MHVHTFFNDELSPYVRSIMVPLWIAAGVTGIRDMGSDLAPVRQLRKDIIAHRVLGSHMVIAGPMLDGPGTSYKPVMRVTTAQDGRRAVDTLKDAGVDFIKSSLSSRETPTLPPLTKHEDDGCLSLATSRTPFEPWRPFALANEVLNT